MNAQLTTADFRSHIRSLCTGAPLGTIHGASHSDPALVRKPTDKGFAPPATAVTTTNKSSIPPQPEGMSRIVLTYANGTRIFWDMADDTADEIAELISNDYCEPKDEGSGQ